MLNSKRIMMLSETVIDDTKIASYGAVLDAVTGKVTFTSRNIDDMACKIYKDVVRADRAEFEDFVYGIQDMMLTSNEAPVEA